MYRNILLNWYKVASLFALKLVCVSPGEKWFLLSVALDTLKWLWLSNLKTAEVEYQFYVEYQNSVG